MNVIPRSTLNVHSYPREPTPQCFERSSIMILKPITTEKILSNNHSQSNECCIGYSYMTIHSKTKSTEDNTSEQRLQQIIGKTHTTEDAKMLKRFPHTSKGIPCRHHRRGNHAKNHKIIYWREPKLKCSKINQTQCKHQNC